jgi:release factor glutamine methyltransferase
MPHQIKNLIKKATEKLGTISDSARLDVELLLAHALQKPRNFLYLNPQYVLTPEELDTFNLFLARRIAGEPIAYILQHREFWSLDFFVNEYVLVPRPDTELLVELTLQLFPADAPINILELGTGSGAVAIAIAHERPRWHITATDQSSEALAVAKYNAKNVGVENVVFSQGNWFDALPSPQLFDAIISNPPYICDDDSCMRNLSFEPKTALLAGKDGLDDIRKIAHAAPRWLKKEEGTILLEHGNQQAPQVKQILSDAGFHNIKCHKDLAGNDRVTYASLKLQKNTYIFDRI